MSRPRPHRNCRAGPRPGPRAARRGRHRPGAAAHCGRIRLLVLLGLRADELAGADVADLGHNRGHRTLTVTRKGGHRVEVVLLPTVAEALDIYLAARMATTSTVASTSMATGGAVEMAAGVMSGGVATVAGPLLATRTGGRLDQAALWRFVRRLARAISTAPWGTEAVTRWLSCPHGSARDRQT